jgi:hypothetical protein
MTGEIADGLSITAEWALLGKKDGESGYRVLECSNGTLGEQNFRDVLTRYSPGTLKLADLPQVVISWLEGDEERRYIAIAIYYRPEDGRVDLGGREFMLTNYFCVPYEAMTAGAVSYLTMYKELYGVDLPKSPPVPIPIRLTTPSGELVANNIQLGMNVAALLLTSRPVCILGADDVNLVGRLTFIDSVASLLPYGMRTRLSASTWTSPLYRTHKLRLFFSSADRGAVRPDNVVHWGRPEDIRIDHAYSLEYLRLQNSGALYSARLAAYTRSTAFQDRDVARMLKDLGRPAPQPVPRPQTARAEQRGRAEPTTRIQQLRAAGRAAAPEMPSAIENIDDMRNIEEIFHSCALALAHGDEVLLESAIGQLQLMVYDRTSLVRRLIGELISEHKLLHRPPISIDESLLCQFYVVLLRLGFNQTVFYESYRKLEASAGYSDGEQLHPPLARALLNVPLQGPVRLLVFHSLSHEEMQLALREMPVPPDESVAMMSNDSLAPVYADIVCGLAIRNLDIVGKAGKADRASFAAALDNKNLVSVLQERYADRPEYLMHLLAGIFQFVSAGKLDRSAAIGILRQVTGAPTVALLGAILRVLKRKDVPGILQDFGYYSITKANLSIEVQRELRNIVITAIKQGLPGNRRPRTAGLRLRNDGMWLPISILVACVVVGIVLLLGFLAWSGRL